MKLRKLFILFLAAAMLLSVLAGCANQSEPAQQPEQTEPQVQQEQPAPTEPVQAPGTEDAAEPVPEVTGILPGAVYRFSALHGQENGQNGLTYYSTENGKTLQPLVSFGRGNGAYVLPNEGTSGWSEGGNKSNNYVVIGYQIPATGAVQFHTRTKLLSGDGNDGYLVKVALDSPSNVVGEHQVVGFDGTDYRYGYGLKVTEGQTLYVIYEPKNGERFYFDNYLLYTGMGEDAVVMEPVNQPLLTTTDLSKLEIKFTHLVGKNNGKNDLTFYYTADGKTLNPLSSYDEKEGKWYKGGDGVLVYPCMVKKDNYGLFGTSSSEYIVMGYKLPASGNINLFTWVALQSGHDYRIKIARGTPGNIVTSFDVRGESQTVEYRNTTMDVKRGDMLYIHYVPLENVNGAWGGFNTSILYNTGGDDYKVFDPYGFEAAENAVGTSIPFTTLVEPGNNGANGLTFLYTEDGKTLLPLTDYVEAEGKWYHGADGTLLYPSNIPADNYGLVGSSAGEYVALEYQINQMGTLDVYTWFALQSGHDYQVQIAKNSPENILYIMDVKGESQTVKDQTIALNVEKGDKLYILYKPLEAENGAWGGYKAQVTWTAVNEHIGPKDPDPIKPDEVVQPDPVVQPDLNDGVTKVLAIGNSFTVDTLELVKKIAASAGETNVQLGKIVIGGANLNNHANNAGNNAPNYEYGISTADGGWYTVYNQTMAAALMDQNWDYVVIQQNSSYSGQASGFDKLNDLLTYIETYSHADTRIVYNMTWAYQQNSTHPEFPWYDSDQSKMYSAITGITQSVVLTNDKIDLVLPTGTAVQNARTSYVGDTLTLDGYHMSRDQGRYVVAMAFAKSVLGIDLSSVSYVPAGVSDTFRQMAAEAVNNACAAPYAVTPSTFTTAPDSETQRETLNFADMAGAVNGAHNLTFYYTTDGKTLVPYTLYDASQGRWYDNSDNQLNMFDPAEVKVNNYGLGQCSATKYVAMGYKAPETGSVDLFNLTVISGPEGSYSYNVRIAKGTPDNTVYQYTLSGTPGASQEERYTIDVQKGEEIFLLYELTQGKELGGWFGYRNTITYRTPETGEAEPEPDVQVGDTFTAVELMPTAVNGEKGMYVYTTTDGVSLGEFTGYTPDVHSGRWYYSVNDTLAAFIDPFVDLGANYGWAGASAGAYPVMAYKMPASGTVNLVNWLANHTGQACELLIAQGTPDNVVKTYSVNEPNGWQEACDLTVTKDQMLYIHYKPVNGPATADTCYFGYKCQYTYTAVEDAAKPEYSVSAGDTVPFASISSLEANGTNGLIFYYTADGKTYTPYNFLDMGNGAWYEVTENAVSKFHPVADAANNYGVVQDSQYNYAAMGYKVPETGTVDLYTWFALQSGHDFQIRIAKGTPDNILYTYDITGESQTVKDWTTTLNVTKGDELFVIFKSTEVANDAWGGYKVQLTWKSVGEQTGPADPDKIIPEDMKTYAVKVGETVQFAQIASVEANGTNGLTFYHTADGKTYTPYNFLDISAGAWYEVTENAVSKFHPKADAANNYGVVQDSQYNYAAMGYKVPETGTVDLYTWFALQSGHDFQIRIAKGTPDNILYTYDITGESQTVKDWTTTLNVTKGDELFVIFKSTEVANDAWGGYKVQLTWKSVGEQTGPADPDKIIPEDMREYAVKVGETVKFAEAASLETNGANGLTMYYTADGKTYTPYTLLDAGAGAWYEVTEGAVSKFHPKADAAANYGVVQNSAYQYTAIGYQVPETGTVDLYTWFALQSGHDFQLRIAKGSPKNILYTYDVAGESQTVKDWTTTLNVNKGEEIYLIFKSTEVANDAWGGYIAQITWKSVGKHTGPADPDKIVPEDMKEYSVALGQVFTSANLMPTASNGEKGMYVYTTADGANLDGFTGYDPNNHGGRWYFMPDGTNKAFVDPFVDAGVNYGWVGGSNGAYVVMGFKMQESGTINLTNWLANHTGQGCELMIATGTPGNVVKTYSVNDPNGWQESLELTVAQGEMVYVIFKPVGAPETADTCYFGYKIEYAYTAFN